MRLLPLAILLIAASAAAQPCEDETGRLFSGPNAFVDGVRPQGYCLRPGLREEQAIRSEAASNWALRQRAHDRGCADAWDPTLTNQQVIDRCLR